MIRKSFLIAILLYAFLPQLLHAFINVESLRQTDQMGFYGSGNIRLSGAAGSTDKIINTLSTQNIYRNSGNEFLFFANHSYGEVSNEKNTHKGSFHIRYTLNPMDTIGAEVYTQAEFNKFRALKLRSLYGAGVRIGVFRHKKVSLFLGAGAFYEHEDLDGDVTEEAVRGNVYISFKKVFKNKTELVSTAYYQPSLSYSDYRLRTNTGLGFPISKNFKFTAEFISSYDSAPPIGVVKSDILYLTGIKYSY